MKWRSRIVWFVFGAVVSAAFYEAYSVYKAFLILRNDPYYVWNASALVIDYMKTHDNRWPKSWADLQLALSEPIEAGGPRYSEELKKKVVIDWNTRPEILVKAKFDDDDGQPAFRVIWLRNGRGISWSGVEPNRLIWEYLQQNKHKLPHGAP